MLSNFGKSRIARGFTLIELMIVVAIIGILAAIAIPNFVKFQCRSKRSEAKTNLKGLYVAMESYRGLNDSYVTLTEAQTTDQATNLIGFTSQGTKQRYNYSSITGGEGISIWFTATGRGHQDAVSNDTWQISQRNDLNTTTATQCD
jgi:type IV pilus assembly protein PilA